MKNIFINIIIIFVSQKNSSGNHVLEAEIWHFKVVIQSIRQAVICFMTVCFNKMIAFCWGSGQLCLSFLCFIRFFFVLNCTLPVPSAKQPGISGNILDVWKYFIESWYFRRDISSWYETLVVIFAESCMGLTRLNNFYVQYAVWWIRKITCQLFGWVLS